MQTFSLATFYSRPDLTELKLIYVEGGNIRILVTKQVPYTERVLDVAFNMHSEDLLPAIEAAFSQFADISHAGTFYDRKGTPYKETFTPEHLQSAIVRALAA